ncbi:PepSY-like domain-containing protein [Maribacter confluentis]|uniref:PepSY-like domain-containing protein n=1 Tax=Maribacter confluentis TaxID=1656093 RepID=A0ABT8RQR1_9FLAO|nr:PepSY-like domain-containing protein [Maribacter confluentis]MDO1512847.1 PepSY-like domain-containing protein [Maribacter confluentis]
MKNKHILTGALATLGIFIGSAQDIDTNTVPANLKDTFEQSYPTANDVEWEKEGTSYKVEFEINAQDHEIWYATDGTTTKTEQELTEADLPQAIRTAITNTYAGYKVDEVEKTTENGSTTYEVELKKGWINEKDVVFNADGTVLREKND